MRLNYFLQVVQLHYLALLLHLLRTHHELDAFFQLDDALVMHIQLICIEQVERLYLRFKQLPRLTLLSEIKF